MKGFLKVVLYLAIGVAVFVSACYIRGMYLPEEHEIERSVTIMAPRAEVWKTILDYEALPQWYSPVTAVEKLPAQNGDTCYLELHKKERVEVCEHVVTEGKEAVDRIQEEVFQGTWTYDLQSINATSTHLTTTEHGRIHSPWSRFLAYQFGLGEELNTFHADLKKRMENK